MTQVRLRIVPVNSINVTHEGEFPSKVHSQWWVPWGQGNSVQGIDIWCLGEPTKAYINYHPSKTHRTEPNGLTSELVQLNANCTLFPPKDPGPHPPQQWDWRLHRPPPICPPCWGFGACGRGREKMAGINKLPIVMNTMERESMLVKWEKLKKKIRWEIERK